MDGAACAVEREKDRSEVARGREDRVGGRHVSQELSTRRRGEGRESGGGRRKWLRKADAEGSAKPRRAMERG